MIVKIHLSAVAYRYYTKEIEVSDDTTKDQLDELVLEEYKISDPEDFGNVEVWERGACYWERTHQAPPESNDQEWNEEGLEWANAVLLNDG